MGGVICVTNFLSQTCKGNVKLEAQMHGVLPLLLVMYLRRSRYYCNEAFFMQGRCFGRQETHLLPPDTMTQTVHRLPPPPPPPTPPEDPKI